MLKYTFQINFKEKIKNSGGNCVESDLGNNADADSADGNIHIACCTKQHEDNVRDNVKPSPAGGECSMQ